VLVKAHMGWVRMNKQLNVPTHTGHMESPNLVTSCVTETEAILPYLMGVHRDSARATNGVLPRHTHGNRALG
jgi:hypothetical protein